MKRYIRCAFIVTLIIGLFVVSIPAQRSEPLKVTIPPRYEKEPGSVDEFGERNQNGRSNHRDKTESENNNNFKSNGMEDLKFMDSLTPTNYNLLPGAFTTLVGNRRGYVPISINQKLGRFPLNKLPNNRIVFTAITSSGHKYLILSAIKPVKLKIEDINYLLRTSFAAVFPWGNVNEKKTMRVNDILTLMVGGTVNKVKVTVISEYYFTLKTEDEHSLKGSATHGVFIDSDGQLWLFEEGIGDPTESKVNQVINQAVAVGMWFRLAKNFDEYIDKLSLRQPGNKQIRIRRQ